MALRLGKFRAGWLPTLAMLVLCVLFLLLANWQWHRAQYKEALLAQYRAQAERKPLSLDALLADPTLESFPPYLRVSAAGRYDGSRQVLLEDMTHGDGVGFEVLTPFLMQSGVVLLVDRGWVAATAEGKAPDVAVGGEPRTIAGALGTLPAPGLKLGKPAPPSRDWPKLMFYPSLQDLRPFFGVKLMTPVLHLDPAQPDGYTRDTTLNVGLPPARHLGYAFQWLMLAAAVFIAWLVANLRRSRKLVDEKA